MGFILKLCIYIVLFFLLSTNIYYFYNDIQMTLRKGHYNDLYNLNGRLEPLTIRGNGGRLGNQMFVFATLYGLATLNKRKLALMPKNYEELNKYFDLNCPKVDEKFRVHDPWMIRHWLTPDDYSIPPSSNIISGNMYPTSYTFFDHVKRDIRKLFRFKTPFLKHAENILSHVKKIRPWTKVYVCVHVRRGDYLRKSKGGWLRAANGREVDINYFRKSVEYFRSKYKNITFLAVSDDRNWTRDNLSSLGILTLPEPESPGHDLAVLSSCNHTIMSYGSFGFWGGYLAGGEVVYFSDFVKPDSKMAEIFVYKKMYPKEWLGISTTPRGFWDKYTNPFVI